MLSLKDEDIIKMYKKGYSINYISKQLYKSLNKNSKPIKFDGVLMFPAKIFKMDYCRTYVCEVIYKNLVRTCLSQFPRLAVTYITNILGLLSEKKRQFNFACQGLRACTQPKVTFTSKIIIAYTNNCKQEYMLFFKKINPAYLTSGVYCIILHLISVENSTFVENFNTFSKLWKLWITSPIINM